MRVHMWRPSVQQREREVQFSIEGMVTFISVTLVKVLHQILIRLLFWDAASFIAIWLITFVSSWIISFVKGSVITFRSAGASSPFWKWKESTTRLVRISR